MSIDNSLCENAINESTMSFLCDDFSFNRARVEKALELYVEAKPKARQFTLGDF